MDISEQYKDLTEKINENLPLKAYPIRELVRNFRNNVHPITLRTELKITSAHNSGDISGIMCTVELKNGYKMACALTHLIFHRSTFLYSEITDYQRNREKRIKQLSSRGMNCLSPSLQHTVYVSRAEQGVGYQDFFLHLL